jgi:hypothetical protein
MVLLVSSSEAKRAVVVVVTGFIGVEFVSFACTEILSVSSVGVAASLISSGSTVIVIGSFVVVLVRFVVNVVIAL